MTDYRLSFNLDSDSDPSDLLDRLQAVVENGFDATREDVGQVDLDSVCVEELGSPKPSRELIFDGQPSLLRSSTDGSKVAFVSLPEGARRAFSDADPETGLGPCCCRFCSPKVGQSRMVATWDTLAICLKTGKTWTCHMPELYCAPLR